MKKQRLFRVFAIIAAIGLITAACKHSSGGGKKQEPEVDIDAFSLISQTWPIEGVEPIAIENGDTLKLGDAEGKALTGSLTGNSIARYILLPIIVIEILRMYR
jgi:hypothetical protein